MPEHALSSQLVDNPANEPRRDVSWFYGADVDLAALSKAVLVNPLLATDTRKLIGGHSWLASISSNPRTTAFIALDPNNWVMPCNLYVNLPPLAGIEVEQFP